MDVLALEIEVVWLPFLLIDPPQVFCQVVVVVAVVMDVPVLEIVCQVVVVVFVIAEVQVISSIASPPLLSIDSHMLYKMTGGKIDKYTKKIKTVVYDKLETLL